MNWQKRIVKDPKICHGHACIKGTKVLVSAIANDLAAGHSHDDIMRKYRISEADIHAVIHYSADLAIGQIFKVG